MVFDLTKETTWDEIQDYYNEIKSSVGDIPIAFVGNHMERINGSENESIKRNRFRNLVESTGNYYFETNSTGEKVDDIFSSLAEATVESFV